MALSPDMSGLARFARRGLNSRTALIALAATAAVAGAISLSPNTSRAEQPAKPAKSRSLGFAFTTLFLDTMDNDQACPNGFNRSPTELYADHLNEADRKEYLANDATRNNFGVASLNKAGKPMCLEPRSPVADYQAAPLLTVVGHVKSFGIDLDGQVSRITGKAAANGCAHDDFVDDKGEPGIDNQYYRTIGCTTGFRNDGIVTQQTYGSEIRNGSWGVLMDVQNVDDPRNDPDVDIGIYSSQDPAPYAAGTTPVPNRSLSADADRKYWSRAKGRIVNGVIMSEPTDVRFLVTPKNNGGTGARARAPREVFLRGARVRLTVLPSGDVEGVLSGYHDLKSYEANFITYHGDNGSASGAPAIGKYTCPSLLTALEKNADGFRDPATGKCTAISQAYRVKGVRAFVITGGEGSGVPQL